MINKPKLNSFIKRTWNKVEPRLKGKGFKTIVINNERSLREFIYNSIPDNCVVGIGNSLSSSAQKIKDILVEKGNKVFYSWNGNTYNRSIDTFEEPPKPEYFLTTAEIIENEGNIVNSEYSSQAASSKNFPKKIIAFSGLNKFKRNSKSEKNPDYVIFDKNPESTEITVAVLPFLNIS